MNCPKNCNTPLQMSERHGVEIDYCPQCRGVWLDRGELDKIIDRAMEMESGPKTVAPPIPDPRAVDDDRYDRDRYEKDRYDRDSDYYKKRRKKSFLGEIFDFD
ncbi:MAG: zf-TFIIB domain-containing protein [Chthonomonas sp.]|nr:zf-TFIIB domain-containing protein [Chthonomonas sp.]